MAPLKDPSLRRGTAIITSATGEITVRIRTRPLPESVLEFLLKHPESMKHLLLDRRTRDEEDVDLTHETLSTETTLSLSEFRTELDELFATEGGEWKGMTEKYYLI